MILVKEKQGEDLHIYVERNPCLSGFSEPWNVCPAMEEENWFKNERGEWERVPTKEIGHCYCRLTSGHQGPHECAECGRKVERLWDESPVSMAQ